jgi:4-amino-4-deoxychorismate lyase
MTAPFLLETVRCQDGKLLALPYHEARMSNSQRTLFGRSYAIDLSKLSVPPYAHFGCWKCRILYRSQLEAVQFLPYQIRPVNRLKIIEADSVDYRLKYADRRALESLFEQRGEADDILMVKNGLIRDTYYANVALWDGYNWRTPAAPMLPGTRRAQLLDRQCLTPAYIRPEDLSNYQHIALFNAMMDLEEGPVLPTTAVS